MEFIGNHLKEARIKKKINLNTISRELKISENILKEIESDIFPDYIDTVFLIGHIRSYAIFLDLDEKLIIENFKIQISFDKNILSREIQKPIKSFNMFSFSKTISFASIILITTSFYYLFIKTNDLQPKYAMTPDILENLESIIEEVDMNAYLDKQLLKDISKNESNKALEALEILDSKDQIITSSSAIASANISEIENLNNGIITLKFLNPTWIQLRDIKDKIIISELMEINDEYSFNFSDNFNLTAGNAGNILILFDGVVKGKAGKLGEVIESLIIDNQFYN